MISSSVGVVNEYFAQSCAFLKLASQSANADKVQVRVHPRSAFDAGLVEFGQLPWPYSSVGGCNDPG